MKEPSKSSSERMAKTSFLLLCLLRTEGGKRPDKCVYVNIFICSLLNFNLILSVLYWYEKLYICIAKAIAAGLLRSSAHLN